MNSTLKLLLVAAAPWIVIAGNPLIAQAAPPKNACSLLTTSEIGAVLGFTVDPGKGSGEHDCQWSQAGAGGYGKGLVLQALGKMGSMTPVERFNTIKAPVPAKGVTKTPVSGIGDDAVYVTTGGLSTMLAVRKGDIVIQIRVYGFSAEQARSTEKALAQDILAKL